MSSISTVGSYSSAVVAPIQSGASDDAKTQDLIPSAPGKDTAQSVAQSPLGAFTEVVTSATSSQSQNSDSASLATRLRQQLVQSAQSGSDTHSVSPEKPSADALTRHPQMGFSPSTQPAAEQYAAVSKAT